MGDNCVAFAARGKWNSHVDSLSAHPTAKRSGATVNSRMSRCRSKALIWQIWDDNFDV